MSLLVAAPDAAPLRPHATVERVVALGAGTTTYYYRTTAGARGSTTSVASIPAGATVQRKVTV